MPFAAASGRELLRRLGRDRADFPLLVVSLEELLDAGVELGLAEDLVRYAVAEEFDSDAVLRLPASVKLLIRECGNGQPESCWSQASIRECARVMPTRPCPTRTLAEAARSAAERVSCSPVPRLQPFGRQQASARLATFPVSAVYSRTFRRTSPPTSCHGPSPWILPTNDGEGLGSQSDRGGHGYRELPAA